MVFVEQPLALPGGPARNRGRNHGKFVIYFQQVCLSVIVVSVGSNSRMDAER